MTEIEKLIKELRALQSEFGAMQAQWFSLGAHAASLQCEERADAFGRAASALTRLTSPVTEGEVADAMGIIGGNWNAVRCAAVRPMLTSFLKGRSQ